MDLILYIQVFGYILLFYLIYFAAGIYAAYHVTGEITKKYTKFKFRLGYAKIFLIGYVLLMVLLYLVGVDTQGTVGGIVMYIVVHLCLIIPMALPIIYGIRLKSKDIKLEPEIEAKELKITNFEDIGKIVDMVHNQYFEKDDIEFDPQSSVIEIKFRREMNEKALLLKDYLIIYKWRCPVVEHVLRIYFAESYQIEGGEIFGFFNTILYDEKDKTITITSDRHMKIEVKVNRFQIEVKNLRKLIEEKTFFSLW